MVKHTQTMCRQFADELFECRQFADELFACVWPPANCLGVFEYFVKLVLKGLTIFGESFIVDVWQGSKYAFPNLSEASKCSQHSKKAQSLLFIIILI